MAIFSRSHSFLLRNAISRLILAMYMASLGFKTSSLRPYFGV
jgi:hypothetical protein